MIWLDLDTLLLKIKNNELTEKNGYHYLLAFVICSLLSGDALSKSITNSWLIAAGVIASLFVVIWGINAAYKENEKYDGKDFPKRMMAIAWVIGVKIVLYLIAFFAIVAACSFFYSLFVGPLEINALIRQIIIVSSSVIVNLIYLRYIVISFRKLSLI